MTKAIGTNYSISNYGKSPDHHGMSNNRAIYEVIHNTILVKIIRRLSNHRDMFLTLEVNILKLITPIILNLVPINHH